MSRELPLAEDIPSPGEFKVVAPGEHTRTCGECQACCVVHDVHPTDDRTQLPLTPAWEECCHQAPGRCVIYDQRPGPCAAYRCMWLLGWCGDAERPDLLGLVVEGSPAYPGAVVVTEVWPGAWETDQARQLLLALRQQVPVLLVFPWGHVKGDPSTPEEVLIDPPEWVVRAFEAAGETLARDS